MATIQELAEELCRLTAKEVNKLSQVMKSEYGIEQALRKEKKAKRKQEKQSRRKNR